MSSTTPEAAAAQVTRRPRHTRMGRSAQAVGVIGILVCVVLAVVLWLGRAWAVNAVDGMTSSIDQGLARADAAATRAADQVDGVASDLDMLAIRAAAVAAKPGVAIADLQPVSAALGAAADRYRAFRSSYADLRERAVSALDTLTRIDRLVPGVSVPQQPIDALAALDTRVQALDAAISGLVAAADTTQPASETADAVATQAASARDPLSRASTLIRSITDTTDALRAEVANLGSTISLLLTIGAVAGTLLLAYAAALHAGLWALGGRWRSG